MPKITLLGITPAPASTRLKELVTVEGVRDNQLIGYGLVVGLAGTGDRRQTIFSAQSLANMLERMGRVYAAQSLYQEALERYRQALDLARGSFSFSSAQPGYTVFTGLLFFLIDDSNTWARMLPALSGSLLVWLPLVIRPSLRDTPLLRRLSLLFALALAIDPALVGLSRQAGSLLTGLSFALLAAAFWLSGRSILAGVFRISGRSRAGIGADVR